MSAIVVSVPTCLLPDEVNRALVRLRTALKGHCDYDQFQVALDLRDESVLPLVHCIVNDVENS